MRIGYDARNMGEKRTGTGVMQENLLDELLLYQEHSFILFGDETYLSKYRYYKNVEIVPVKTGNKFFREQLIMSYYLIKKRADVFFSTKNFTVPLLFAHRTLCTILDTIPYVYPKVYMPTILHHIYYRLLKSLAEKSKAIITISEHSQQDIRDHITYKKKSYILPLAANKIFCPSNVNRQALEANHLKQPYFLVIGGAEPRKNNQVIIQAFERFRQNNDSYYLVIVGGKEWKGYELEIPLSMKDNIVILDFVEEELLPSLFFYAEALIFASKYEGFGLPILEAMHLGVPTIVANNSSLKEIYGQASLMVETMDIEGYAQAMEMIACQGRNLVNLDKYRELTDRYTWKQTARELLNIINKEFTKK